MLRLPGKFADVLAGQGSWLLQLRTASGGTRCSDAEVLFDFESNAYLAGGWKNFADMHGSRRGTSWSLLMVVRPC